MNEIGRTNNFIELAFLKTLNGSGGTFDLDVRMNISKGDFIILCGPSGAGKTTLLRLIAGLDDASTGRLKVDGEVWLDRENRKYCPVKNRQIGFVFQDYGLFPNMTVYQNLRYGMAKAAKKETIQTYLEIVGLAELQQAYPARLSGGQKQRLALIRALARQPKILLLDEPLSALDPEMRNHLQQEIKRLHGLFKTTTIMVSHDRSEIRQMADRVIMLRQGKVEQDYNIADFCAATCDPTMVFDGEFISGPRMDGNICIRMGGRSVWVKTEGLLPNMKAGQLVKLHPTVFSVTAIEE